MEIVVGPLGPKDIHVSAVSTKESKNCCQKPNCKRNFLIGSGVTIIILVAIYLIVRFVIFAHASPALVRIIPKATTGRRLATNSVIWASDVPTASNNSFSYLKVEFLEIQWFGLNFLSSTNPKGDNVIPFKQQTWNTDGPISTWGPSSSALDIVNGAASTIDSDASPAPASGQYKGMSTGLLTNYTVKGYCKTQNNIVYTSATGIKTTPISSYTSTSPPADYDSYFVGIPYDSVNCDPNSHAFAANSQGAGQLNIKPECISSQNTLFLNLNYVGNGINTFWLDTTGMIACYDGTLPSLTSNPIYQTNPPSQTSSACFSSYFSCTSTLNKQFTNTGVLLPPFCNQNCPKFGFGTQFYATYNYDAATPAIGMDYSEPMTFTFNSVASSVTSTPFGESYIYTDNINAVNSFKTSGTVDMLNDWTFFIVHFNPDKTIQGINLRNPLKRYMNFGTFLAATTLNGDGTYTIKTRSDDYTYNFSDCESKFDRILTGFQRILGEDYSTIISVTLGDGPDCGLAYNSATMSPLVNVPYTGPGSNSGNWFYPKDGDLITFPCLGGAKTLYFKKITT